MARFEEQETEESVEETTATPETEVEEGTTEEVAPTEEVSSEASTDEELTTEQLEESAEAEVAPQVTPQGKPYYTAEEMKNLDPEIVDTTRIPTEYVPFYKAMLAGFTKNQQKKMAEIQKQALKEPVPAQTATKPSTIYEAFDQNPQQVLTDVRNAIYQKKEADPFDPDIIKLEKMRDELVERGMQQQAQKAEIERVVNQVNTLIAKEIPDIETKRDSLNEFAGELGLSMEELNTLTNPVYLGPLAAKLAIALNKAYNMRNQATDARKNLEKKKVKTAPKVLEPGKGFKTAKEEEHTAERAIATAGQGRFTS